MGFWRRTCRISRKDRIRNTYIKPKMNVTRSFVDDVKMKELQFYGHIQWSDEERLPKRNIMCQLKAYVMNSWDPNIDPKMTDRGRLGRQENDDWRFSELDIGAGK